MPEAEMIRRVAGRMNGSERIIACVNCRAVHERLPGRRPSVITLGPRHFQKANARKSRDERSDARCMVSMAVRHEDLRKSCARERLLHCFEVPRLSGAGVDERRHMPANQPRPVAIARVGPWIEGVNRNRLQQPDCVNRITMLSITLALLGEIRTTRRSR